MVCISVPIPRCAIFYLPVRQNARNYGGNVTKVKRNRIYARDGWICQLCLLPVDPLEDRRMRASLDHIIRVRDGGTNDDENLRLAHQICNELRERDLEDFGIEVSYLSRDGRRVSAI